MKKTKQIEYHTCDFCGKECDPTPQYRLPQFELYPICECYGGWRTVPKQLDICGECEDEIAEMLDKFRERMERDNDLSSRATLQQDTTRQDQESGEDSEE